MARSDTCGGWIGTTFAAKRWLSLDVCGLVCVLFSFSIHIFALSVISTHLVSSSLPALVVFGFLYCPASVMALSSLFMAWTTDPGAVPMGARPLEMQAAPGGDLEQGGGEAAAAAPAASGARRGLRRCRKCNDNYKPPRAHHDSVTGRCIVKMDHFCPWVGNAVGALNHKFFFLFILYTLITSLLSLFLLIMRFVRCGYLVKVDPEGGSGGGSNATATDDDGSSPGGTEDAEHAGDGGPEEADPTRRMLLRWLVGDDSSSSGDDGSYDFKYPGCDGLYSNEIIKNEILILFVVTILFMIFTCTMLCEQVDAIQSNTGKIARMKMRAGKGGDELRRVATSFNEMFGGDSPDVSLHWFLPTRVRFPDGMHDTVMGFEYDPSWGDAPYREPDDMMTMDGTASALADGGGGGVGAERQRTTTLRAGGAAAPIPPLVPQPVGSESVHSTASGGSSTRKRKDADSSREKEIV